MCTETQKILKSQRNSEKEEQSWKLKQAEFRHQYNTINAYESCKVNK